MIGETEQIVHVKNTGRCRELLVPGAAVYLAKAANPARKTAYDLIAVEKIRKTGRLLVNMDAQAPNQVLYEALAGGLRLPGQTGPWRELRREVSFGTSRFDIWGVFADGKEAFLEVKGVTLEEDGIARFPDAPTLRGAKHLRELAQAAARGYAAYVIFVLQMAGMAYFTPHDQRDPEFGRALRAAYAGGVGVLAYQCRVRPDRLVLGLPAPVRL
jgi:sugar fermentation stimulation protein A